MFGEHIEEMAKLFEEDGPVTEARLPDLAMAVADVAYAQGLIASEDEIDLAVEQIQNEARYLLSL